MPNGKQIKKNKKCESEVLQIEHDLRAGKS